MLIPCFLMLLFSCNDGDLQIETLDFDSASIQACDSPIDVEQTTLFFKIQGAETLILDLQSGLLENTTSEISTISSTIPGESQLTYRFFSDDVTSAYFCGDIPPATPTVLDEIEAENGIVNITSTASSVTSTTKTYTHEIIITDLTLVNNLNERLTDESGLDYGDVTTSIGNSATLSFSNYNDIAISLCENAPADGQIRLYKIVNDEFLSLDIPGTAIVNEATTTPREIDLASNGTLKNYVVNTIATSDLVCTAGMLNDDNTVGEFFSAEGTVKVSTVENAPDTEGAITYTHTITLENVRLTLRGQGEEADVVLSNEIETFTFGSFTTIAN